MESSKLNVSNIMNVAKIFAILSVITAHSRSTEYYMVSTITERLGAIGVPVFLFISGYYFNVKGNVKNFWKKKIKTIFIPWIFTGCLVFIVSSLKLHFSNFKLLNLVNWIIGNGTYLWYLTALILCYLLLMFVKRKIYLLIFIIINVISLILTSFGICNSINPYLNVFNWIGYFSLGVLAKGSFERFLSFFKAKAQFIIPLYIVCLIISFFIEPNSGGYFSKLAIPMQIMGMICIFSISTMKFFNKLAVYKLADLTFSIYLTHFIVFPVKRILIQNPFFEFINPAIIGLLDVALLMFMWKISSLIKLNKIYSILIGMRDRPSVAKQHKLENQNIAMNG